MATGGDSANFRDLFPDYLVPDILELVIEGWERFTKPDRDAHEVPITKNFCLLLQTLKNASDMPFKIRWELSILDSTTDDDLGRADLFFDFTGTNREEVYFLFECKRLGVDFHSGRQSLAGDYVGDDGMMCFITGKYSAGLPAGGMIGYVMDGDDSRAQSSVRKLINKKREMLLMAPNTGMERCGIFPENPTVKQTMHHPPGRELTLYHLFLRVA